MICKRCGHQGITAQMTHCPNCEFPLKSQPRTRSVTAQFRALNARRKKLTQQNYALPFTLGTHVFEKYKIQDLLGQGPMGVVYQVKDQDETLWALKLIHKRWLDGADLDQFQGHYLSFENLKSSSICLPNQIIVESDKVGILMPFQEGLTLRKVMNLRKTTSKAFDLDEVVDLLNGIRVGLETLHHDGVCHGGLKPENVFLSKGTDHVQNVTLSDIQLGLAIGIESFYKAQRSSGQGTYLAPESGQGQLTQLSDIYSLGVFVFEGLSGQSFQSKKSIQEYLD